MNINSALKLNSCLRTLAKDYQKKNPEKTLKDFEIYIFRFNKKHFSPEEIIGIKKFFVTVNNFSWIIETYFSDVFIRETTKGK